MCSQEIFSFLPNAPHKKKFVGTKTKLSLCSIYVFMAKKNKNGKVISFL